MIEIHRYVPEFKDTMPFYKIHEADGTRRGLHYKKGLNIDPEPFRPYGQCVGGGMYFASKYILQFLSYGTYIREVTIPDGAKVYIEGDKYKSVRFVLGKRERITANVIIRLLNEGAEVPLGDRAHSIMMNIAVMDKSIALFRHPKFEKELIIRYASFMKVIKTNDANFVAEVLRLVGPWKTGEYAEHLCDFSLNPKNRFSEDMKQVIRDYFKKIHHRVEKKFI